MWIAGVGVKCNRKVHMFFINEGGGESISQYGTYIYNWWRKHLMQTLKSNFPNLVCFVTRILIAMKCHCYTVLPFRKRSLSQEIDLKWYKRSKSAWPSWWRIVLWRARFLVRPSLGLHKYCFHTYMPECFTLVLLEQTLTLETED